MMNVFAVLVVGLLIFFAVLTFFYLVRFAFVHIKASIIRHKLSKLAETEKKDD